MHSSIRSYTNRLNKIRIYYFKIHEQYIAIKWGREYQTATTIAIRIDQIGSEGKKKHMEMDWKFQNENEKANERKNNNEIR